MDEHVALPEKHTLDHPWPRFTLDTENGCREIPENSVV